MVIFLQRVSVRKLPLNFLISRKAGISYKSDQCPFNETFFPLLAYISDLEGGDHLAGRNGQFSPASPSADQAGSLHSRCKIYIQIIFVFFFQRFLTQCLQCFMKRVFMEESGFWYRYKEQALTRDRCFVICWLACPICSHAQLLKDKNLSQLLSSRPGSLVQKARD